ncbi:solute carrier family 23 member 3 [Pelobates cultripes]|uniref:Solute carrier family 23 member 3 n=1 Tax=Pelobates cultripes TaxID=61616 RepID=A0AAD1SL68_PELCU|nr:solute carrier family 23 member 3 [Pelobates cultripes]
MSCVCCGHKHSRLPSYRLHHSPPWLLSFIFAIQHLLVLASIVCTSHHLLLQARPLGPADQSRLFASSLFACGFATALQSTLGTRLPLVQAPTFELLIPALTLHQHSAGNRTSKNDTQGSIHCAEGDCDRLKNNVHFIAEVSGAVLVAGALQVAFGASGLLGRILQNCGPMVKAPALSIIGLSCYKQAALFCSFNWIISLLLILITGVLSQICRSCYLPICTWRSKKDTDKQYFPALRMFSLVLTISCTWIICSSLRMVNERAALDSAVRSSVNDSTFLTTASLMGIAGTEQNAIEPAAWFKIPSLGAWGWPQFTLHSLSVGIAMALTSSLSSLCCYILCDRMIDCPPIPSQACNRGICMEGAGNILSGILGSICGAGSSIPNAGMAGITKVGCRHSVHITAFLLIALGCSPRISEFLMDIPFAVHGAVLSLTYSMALGGGISYFQYADIDSGRNIFIVGFTMFIALLIPRWLEATPGILFTGWRPLDLLLLGLLTVPIFLGALFSFILDNTVSGTLQERGLHSDQTLGCPVSAVNTPMGKEEELTKSYGLPLMQNCLFPAVYPCNQLCPLHYERVDIVERV